MQEIIFKIRCLKEHYQTILKKLTLIFLPNPVLFNGQDYEKQKGPGSSDKLSKLCKAYKAYKVYYWISQEQKELFRWNKKHF